MIEKEIFETNNSVSQNQANAEMIESGNPTMDVSNYSSVISDETETTSSLQVDPNNIVSDNAIPESNEQSSKSTNETNISETPSLDQAKVGEQNSKNESLKGSSSSNNFPIDSLENAPNNQMPEPAANDKAVQEMVLDNSELSLLKLVQKKSEKLTDIEKIALEKRIKDLEQEKATDSRSSEAEIRKNITSARSIKNNEGIGLSDEKGDLASFLNSTKEPPIWRVL